MNENTKPEIDLTGSEVNVEQLVSVRLKLYKVTLKVLTNPIGVSLHESYVVATDTNMAYKKIRDWLDKKDYGFSHERELMKIELLAEDYEYTDVRTRLFV